MITQAQITNVTQTMSECSNEMFERLKKDIENPMNMESLKRQYDWLEILDKTKKSFELLIQYVGKGAAILFVNGKLVSVKWYNIFGLIKLIDVGRLFVNLIQEVYKIWK